MACNSGNTMMAEMVKIVINRCYGGFGLSEDAMRLYAEKKDLPFYVYSDPKYSGSIFKSYFTADPSGMTRINSDFYRKYHLYDLDIERNDPVLVEVVEELGDKANGMCAKLMIEEVPKGTLYRIDEYDGMESLVTTDNIEWKIA
jgi:hypothetical protein